MWITRCLDKYPIENIGILSKYSYISHLRSCNVNGSPTKELLSQPFDHYNIAPATATPSAPIIPFPNADVPCPAALVLCAIALLPVALVELLELVVFVLPPELVAIVLPPDVDVESPPATDDAAVVFAAAPELPVCFAFAAPAVMTTGMKDTSVELSVAVVRGGIPSVPEVIDPEAEAVQIAWVLPMSWQSTVSTPLVQSDMSDSFVASDAVHFGKLGRRKLTHLERCIHSVESSGPARLSKAIRTHSYCRRRYRRSRNHQGRLRWRWQ